MIGADREGEIRYICDRTGIDPDTAAAFTDAITRYYAGLNERIHPDNPCAYSDIWEAPAYVAEHTLLPMDLIIKMYDARGDYFLSLLTKR